MREVIGLPAQQVKRLTVWARFLRRHGMERRRPSVTADHSEMSMRDVWSSGLIRLAAPGYWVMWKTGPFGVNGSWAPGGTR